MNGRLVTNLLGANLSAAVLPGVNLRRANLLGANLSEAYLRRANLSRANLSGAGLSASDLSEANLLGASFLKRLVSVEQRDGMLILRQ